MSSILEKLEPSRRICPVIFLLDTSGSMNKLGGSPIVALNAMMDGVLRELVSMNHNNPDVEIKIAILTFDSGIKWVTGEDGLVNPADYPWNSLMAWGDASMGLAFKELERILSDSHGFMKNASGLFAPVLFLLSYGEPTDEYKDVLRELQQHNGWYMNSTRVAVGYGACNKSVLVDFTGNSETVLIAQYGENLANYIRFILPHTVAVHRDLYTDEWVFKDPEYGTPMLKATTDGDDDWW